MRKVFYLVAVIALAAVVMPSCSNKERCWKGKIKVEGRSETIYVWGTEDDVDAALGDWKNNLKEDYGQKGTYTIEKYKASQEECEDKDDYVDVDDIEIY